MNPIALAWPVEWPNAPIPVEAVEDDCPRCHLRVRVGPRIRAAVDAGIAVLRCAVCALEAGSLPVVSLGGTHSVGGVVPEPGALQALLIRLQAKRRVSVDERQ
jgi:hypothetical protein